MFIYVGTKSGRFVLDAVELNNNIYGVNPQYPVFGRFTSQRPAASRAKIPEIKDTFKKRTDRSNDDKFSFFEYAKNTVVGAGQFFTDIVKNIVKNPLMAVPAMVITGAIASSPLGFAVLTGVGLTAGLFGLAFLGFRSAGLIGDKKWDELEKTGKDLGKLISGTALSAVGAVKAARQLNPSSTVMQSFKKAFTFDNISWSAFKNTIMLPGRAFKSLVLRKPLKNGFFIRPIKADYKNFVSELKEPLFSPDEINYLKDAKLFDWTFRKPLQAILGAITGKTGE